MEMPSFLAALDPADRHTALGFLEEVQIPAGELLMHGSFEGECLAYVVQGEVEVHAGGSVVGRAGAGEWVGETAMFPKAARRATVYVTADAWLLVVSTENYIGMRRGEHRLVPILEQEVLGNQLARLRRQGERLAELSPGPQSSRPSPSFFSRIGAQFGKGGMLSVLPDLDVAAELRALGLVDDEATDFTARAVASVF
jgi:CRP-like cAMP-binding protein